MLVQDRSKLPRSPPPPHRFSGHPKSLDSSSWISDNLSRILAAAFVAASAFALLLLLLRGSADSSSLLCFRSPSRAPNPSSLLHLPTLPSSVPPLPDLSSPFSSFRSENWIVVFAPPTPPSPSLRRLSRLKGWQLLAVGDSRSPLDWSLKGAIFLSLDDQASLRLRILDHLPFSSPSRKSVGYLFAIQHGACRIFDADHRADLLGSDLSLRFDLDLSPAAPILQYSPAANRTVVNPYIHFGQRSVWPRGLPLEDVGEIAHEEFYVQALSGRQFIQQGLSNGLPDVDSIFYFTRKAESEAFDIRFDNEAPKVAVPQGTMVPVNSFNTLFHSPAFWGLMLPVTVSSMAADVLRGYWAQRILWEIGGFVAVFPPTIHRLDQVEGYPFSEEKDLHVNVGRLIKFLISWRSSKTSLFEKILDLSYAMAEEGFWSEVDVRFTEAWLQDLLAVGYQQPRLMTLEFDRPKAVVGHGDRQEFIPRKLPSVHLGVEEAGTVNYEIGNLIRWRKNFGNIVLIMFCSRPVERTALEWRLLYGRIFKTVVILSEQNNTDLAVEYGQLWQAYKYLPKIFERFTGVEGFLYLQDDAVLNYWNLLQADNNKLWITDKVPQSWMTVPIEPSTWFSRQAAMVKKVVDTLPAHFQVSYKESMNENSIVHCTSEIFYVPQRFVGDFADLAGIVGDLEIHHKIAVPMFFIAMDSPRNFDSSALGTMIYRSDLQSNVSLNIYSAQVPAIYPCNITSELDFIELIRIMATGDPFLMEMV